MHTSEPHRISFCLENNKRKTEMPHEHYGFMNNSKKLQPRMLTILHSLSQLLLLNVVSEHTPTFILHDGAAYIFGFMKSGGNFG